MFRPRVIPALLLKGEGLVKTVRFRDERYIGDPINAVRIFNDMEADELVFLDIAATPHQKRISTSLVKTIGDEAFMPFAVGGGVSGLRDFDELLSAGAEKIVINTAAVESAQLVEEAALKYGSQSVIVSIDVKKAGHDHYLVYVRGGRTKAEIGLNAHLKRMESAGAGEILVNSIDRDGTMQGYDLDLIRAVSSCVAVPVIACGGAGRNEDLRQAYREGGASAVAAGSLFVYSGPRQAVLINYPDSKELCAIFS